MVPSFVVCGSVEEFGENWSEFPEETISTFSRAY